jgi:hypothetical protein
MQHSQQVIGDLPPHARRCDISARSMRGTTPVVIGPRYVAQTKHAIQISSGPEV